jgi:hypothetical protein
MSRVLSVGVVVVAVAALAFVPALVADDKGGKDTSATFMGKISKLDSTKHELTLSDVKAGGVSDKSTTTDKGTTADKDKGGTAAGGQYVFEVEKSATITLDGKTADFKDLREGLFARVHVDKSSTTDKGASEKDKGGTAVNPRWKTNRIEAFTKEPPATKDK